MPTATVTVEPSSTPVPATQPNVQITCIFFDGEVYSTESDEYVEIANFGDATQDMAGWTLVDVADGTPTFVFSGWTLEPGGAIRVYTNEVHIEWGGFSFGRGTSIWNNSVPDEAGLFNQSGELVSTRSYPPGCDG